MAGGGEEAADDGGGAEGETGPPQRVSECVFVCCFTPFTPYPGPTEYCSRGSVS